MQVSKYEALGNDYLVLENGVERPAPALVRRLCRPHSGPGADGVLWPTAAAAGASGVRILNPDGSGAEVSGSGVRIFARVLVDRGLADTGRSLIIDTGGRRVSARVAADRRSVAVAMGAATFASADIPLAGASRTIAAVTVDLADMQIEVWPVGLGNPHCVVFDRPVTRDEACALGPRLENHTLFPARTNVQLVEVIDRSTLRIEIWERGAGYTLASGSSACAAAAVAARRDLIDRSVAVHMPGGALHVRLDASGLHQEGPVRHVYDAILSQEWLADR